MTAPSLPKEPRTRAFASLCAAAFLAFSSCSNDNGIPPDAPPGTTVSPELLDVQYGRLVDVYGLVDGPDGTTFELFAADVVIGSDISDQRTGTSNVSDAEITYDFISTDPATLQPRLLITRRIGTQAFATAFDALDDELRSVSPMRYGEGSEQLPFSVVPRNAALRLTWSADLEIDDRFFVTRTEEGFVTSLVNTEAVQLLRIVGDPEQEGAFVPLPIRIIPRAREIVIDPVLLGNEGVQYQTSNNASGMPASPDPFGANIRIAVALDGPLAIPGLRESDVVGITGNNNSGRQAIVRDFRSGNDGDVSSELANGFVRDTLPLRMVGSIPFYLERVDSISASIQEITIFKNGITHEIDRGDVFSFLANSASVPLEDGEVLVDPADDLGDPEEQHVRVRIRRVPGLAEIDPRNLPGYPQLLQDREPWLVQNAPRALLACEFTAGDENGRDDPVNFLTFTPQPLSIGGFTPAANQFVSPFAGAVVRFNKPVDLDSVKWADTFFFAMRDLTSAEARQQFIESRPNNLGGTGMDPATFNEAKYRTPFLITSRIVDVDGSQTTLQLQPTAGFYLDETMRNAADPEQYRYFLHVISDSQDGGVQDLAGNRLDLQGTTAQRSNQVVMDFTVDTRKVNGNPVFEDNLAISIVRRFRDRDEDERPSMFLGSEVRAPGGPQDVATQTLEDLFGAFLYLDGRLQGRPTTRTRTVADSFNQAPAIRSPGGPPNALPPIDPLAWCPQTVFDPGPFAELTDNQQAANTATQPFGQPIQTPLNPTGCRMQTCWREVDLSLSRDNPFDFNLDIEQMYWAPFDGDPLFFDEFDRTSLRLGHSEYRPSPCVGDFSSLPSLHESGLRGTYQLNWLRNQVPQGSGQAVESFAPITTAYADKNMRINPSALVFAANGGSQFLSLPEFEEPYFVWRDETVLEQGGDSDSGSDVTTNPSNAIGQTYAPYILTPFRMGQAMGVVDGANGPTLVRSFWNDARNWQLANNNVRDRFTGGLCGSISMPLLADFQIFYDSTELPVGQPFFATGINGWQVSITLQSDPRPRFRVFSAGRSSAAPQGELAMGPNSPGWEVASGGWAFQPNGAPWTVTPPPPPSQPAGPDIKGDNTFYWIMMDVLRRRTVVTNGFIDLNNPHRVPEDFDDPRLGPFFLQGGNVNTPADTVPEFAWSFDPPLSRLPAGTSVVPQFRAAGEVDATPWYWQRWIDTPNRLWPTPNNANPSITTAQRAQLRPDANNFPLDPYKAGDAHLRKWDTRPEPSSGASRDWWTYLYNRNVTGYVEDANELMDPAYLQAVVNSTEPFVPQDVRYLNWRFLIRNNSEAEIPVDPSIETFALSYRFERR
jgi:hypothetical protein